MMLVLGAGLLAVVLGWTGNKLIWRLLHGRGTAWSVPVWEELVKTVLGYAVGHVFAVHLLFGLGEAGYEFMRGKTAAGISALAGHAAFGLIVVGLYRVSGSIVSGMLAAALVHGGWNWFVLSGGKCRK